MRYLLIADIHSNPYPLLKCLDKERGRFDEIIFLGDYISDMPFPDRTMDYLYNLKNPYPSYFIKGNREQYQIDRKNNLLEFYEGTSSSGSLLYTYRNLRAKDFLFFEGLKQTELINVPNYGNIRICHGTPDSLYQLISPRDNMINDIIDNMDTDVLICAHSHVQFVYRKKNKIIINPGSIGIPLGSNGVPQYGVLTTEDGKVNIELKSINYDKTKIINDIYASGLLEQAPIYTKLIIHEIKTGIDYMPVTLSLAKKIAMESGIPFSKHSVPEECWRKAYEIMLKEKIKG